MYSNIHKYATTGTTCHPITLRKALSASWDACICPVHPHCSNTVGGEGFQIEQDKRSAQLSQYGLLGKFQIVSVTSHLKTQQSIYQTYPTW